MLSSIIKRLGAAALAALLSFSFAVPVPAAQAPGPVVKIFHTGSSAGQAVSQAGDDGTLERFGYAELKSLVAANSESGEYVLLLDGGGTFQGTGFAAADHGSGIAGLMEAAGYHAAAPSGRDFDGGLQRLEDLSQEAGITLLGANVRSTDGQPAKGIKEYKIYKAADMKIGVFGLTSPEAAAQADPRGTEGLRFEDPAESARRMVELLRDNKQVDLVVCLTAHDGGIASEELARQVDGIDLFLDVGTPPAPQDEDTQEEPVESAVSYASGGLQAVGMVTISFGRNGAADIQVNTLAAEEYTADSLAPDKDVADRLAQIEAGLNGKLAEPVGTAKEQLTREAGLPGRLAAEMLRETDADLAVLATSALIGSLPAGTVTRKDVLDALPYGDSLVTATIKGKQIREAVQGDGLFWAGLEHRRTGDGEQLFCGDEPLEDDRDYTVAATGYLAAGGGNAGLKGGNQEEFIPMQDVLIQSLRETLPLA